MRTAFVANVHSPDFLTPRKKKNKEIETNSGGKTLSSLTMSPLALMIIKLQVLCHTVIYPLDLQVNPQVKYNFQMFIFLFFFCGLEKIFNRIEWAMTAIGASRSRRNKYMFLLYSTYLKPIPFSQSKEKGIRVYASGVFS